MVDVDDIMKRLRALAWYGPLDSEERRSIAKLASNAFACEAVEFILNELDDPKSPWNNLNSLQVKAQILGAIEREERERHLREGLNRLDWYQDLASDDEAQSAVRRTVLNTMRIAAATQKTARRVDEKLIAATNPWSTLLLPRPRSAPLPQSPKQRSRSAPRQPRRRR